MKLIKTRGIVVKETTYGESDKIITILTEDYGLVSAIAKGAKRSNSQVLASSQYLVFSEFVLFKGSKFYHVNSASSISTFYKLRTDMDKLMSIFELTKSIISLTDENMDSTLILKLFLNTLYIMENKNKNVNFVASIFKIKMLSYLGFASNFNECLKCKKEFTKEKENVYYDYTNNTFYCENCLNEEKKRYIKLSFSTFYVIKYIILSDMKKIYCFSVKKENEDEMRKFGQAFMDWVLHEI